MERERKFDIVIFGASGFTGRYVIEYALKHIDSTIKIAVAGRSIQKLQSILIADVSDSASLNSMAKSTKVVINLTGPYRTLGEPVIKACIENFTDYVDITGEPEVNVELYWKKFMEKMHFKYNNQAKENGVICVQACGFDSVPADITTLKMQRKLNELIPDVDIEYIESYLSLHSDLKITAHYTTWESAVLGFSNYKSFSSWRKKKGLNSDIVKKTSNYKPIQGWRWHNMLNCYVNLFPGADASVVKRSQTFLADKGFIRYVPYGAYFTTESWWSKLKFEIFGLLFLYPSFFSFGAFSHEGPSKEQVDHTFFTMISLASVILTNYLCTEPGYVSTSMIIIQSAICILKDKQKIMAHNKNKGGIFTPSAAFYGTSFLEALEKCFDFSNVSEIN
ncbi:hypothetical protein ROZALSC1DRAFT_29965 [Rozella allomycis CSF55]|uniref:Saccharopine dehydrogenase / Homospermidine synthase domain-containing protein n=1 Tax=Rozella allomycis (strain CSF55) TaxID=988480 RepID=A0A075B519_ROZAC|nr:Saccharopine dehydrogenase / Homospermidine synthase domain-containing protein [Rozella allomycis CSF55]RKP18329.1 hypothetical protein ROZALSC1DRAFT_29965 [Rozella allomycis CSF55]|eukprot:EPZ36846.1 Saccharopine dehydrogenase / Homospermidine synthase domain-containing protein [Rozella allomycis CSF55]